MHTGLHVNRNMKKMFLSSLEGESGRGETRRTLTLIHLPPFIFLPHCLAPSLSLHLPHDTHTQTHSSDEADTKIWMVTVLEEEYRPTHTHLRQTGLQCLISMLGDGCVF